MSTQPNRIAVPAVVIPFPNLREKTAFDAQSRMKDFVEFPVDLIKGLSKDAKPCPFSPYGSILRSIEQYGAAWTNVLIHEKTHALIAGRSRVLAYRELAKKDPEKWKTIPAWLVDCEPGSPEAEFLRQRHRPTVQAAIRNGGQSNPLAAA